MAAIVTQFCRPESWLPLSLPASVSVSVCLLSVCLLCAYCDMQGVREMMNDFFAIESDGRQLMPVQGLNAMTTSYYLNHAESRGGKVNMQVAIYTTSLIATHTHTYTCTRPMHSLIISPVMKAALLMW